MPTANLFKEITGAPSLAKFSQQVAKLKSPALGKLRTTLLRQLSRVVEYRGANEWARAVAICEALAVVGWGKKERVDAIAHFNGDCWETYFMNAKGEKRYLETRWSKRKLGWQPFNPEYHWSPDRPKVPAKDWRLYRQRKAAPVLRPSLSSQVNYLRQQPIVMGMVGGIDPVSLSVARLKTELDALFTEHLAPGDYGPDLEFFYFTLHCPALNAKGQNRLKIGAFQPKRRSFYCDLYFAQSFDGFEVEELKEYLRVNLLAAVDRLESVARKKKLNCDVSRLRDDIAMALEVWIAA